MSTVIFQGLKQDVILPSGRKITIRENNGEDEGILTTFGEILKGNSFCNYLSSITEFDTSMQSKPKPSDILGWLRNDVYYTLLVARILSIGNQFKFKKTCDNPSCNREELYEEDLTPFTSDFTGKMEKENPFEYRIIKYPLGMQQQCTYKLSSGKNIRFNLLTVAMENAGLDVVQDQRNRNTPLIDRGLALETSLGQFDQVFNFQCFSSREMLEIRGKVKDVDEQWALVSEITCPKCKNKVFIDLLTQPDFFFPTEM